MPTENDDVNKSVALALQRVFYELQHRYHCTKNEVFHLGFPQQILPGHIY